MGKKGEEATQWWWCKLKGPTTKVEPMGAPVINSVGRTRGPLEPEVAIQDSTISRKEDGSKAKRENIKHIERPKAPLSYLPISDWIQELCLKLPGPDLKDKIKEGIFDRQGNLIETETVSLF